MKTNSIKIPTKVCKFLILFITLVFLMGNVNGIGQALSESKSNTITLRNNMPYADDQEVSVVENGSIVITLTGGDIDGDEVEFYLLEGPSHGTLGELVGSQVTYSPDADYNGSDSFIFAVADGYPEAASAEGVVSITVLPENNIPVAYSRFVRTAKNRAVSIVLTGSDADNDSLTYIVISPPSNGSLSGSAPDLIYTPMFEFTGNDVFSFIVIDGKANSSPATIQILVSSFGKVIVIWDNFRPIFGGVEIPLTRIQQ